MAKNEPDVDGRLIVQAMAPVGVDELQPYHKNPRRGDIDAIARSLEVNGQYRPVVVNLGRQTGRPMEVLAGNHTLAAAKRLGWDTIAAVTVDVDDMAAARIVVADNRTADLAGNDDATLVALLQELHDETGLDGTGYDDDDLAKLLGNDTDADLADAEVEDAPVAWGVVVDLDTEDQQTRLLEQLIAEGFRVRALM